MREKKPHPRAWLPEHDELLRQVWSDPLPLKTHMHLFPNRTHAAVIARGVTLDLPDRRQETRLARAEATTGARIREQMELSPGTAQELATRSIASKRTVQNFIERHRAEMRIVAYRPRGESGPRPAVFAWGAGDDIPKPRPQSPAAIAKRYYRKRRRDPYQREMDAERQRIRYMERTGKLVRRDEAAVALFGEPGAAVR